MSATFRRAEDANEVVRWLRDHDVPDHQIAVRMPSGSTRTLADTGRSVEDREAREEDADESGMSWSSSGGSREHEGTYIAADLAGTPLSHTDVVQMFQRYDLVTPPARTEGTVPAEVRRPRKRSST